MKVGPLELRQEKGFDQFMKQAIQEFKKSHTPTLQSNNISLSTNFVVVVREGLVDEFMKHYEIEHEPHVHTIRLSNLQDM